MDSEKFEACLGIINLFEEMHWTEYEFKTPIKATAFDGNEYTIHSIIYDENDDSTDFDGALLVEVSTDWLPKTNMYIEGIPAETVNRIVRAIPVKLVVRVTAHFGGGEDTFVVTEAEVDSGCSLWGWCKENLKGLDWEEDDVNQLVCYGWGDKDFGNYNNYLLANLTHKHGE